MYVYMYVCMYVYRPTVKLHIYEHSQAPYSTCMLM